MEIVKIEKLDLYKLLNGEFVQLGVQIGKVMRKYDPLVLKVKPQLDAFELKLVEMDRLYRILTSSALTNAINLADIRRDRAINGISTTADARTYSYLTEEVAAAQLIRKHIDKYGTGIARQSQNLESANLRNLSQDMKEIPELMDAVNRLGLIPWIDEMDAANLQFETLFEQRNSEIGQMPDDTLREKRVEAYDLFYKLRDKLEAQANVNEYVAPYTQAIQDWNGTQLPYSNIIALRASGGSEDVDTPPTESVVGG